MPSSSAFCLLIKITTAAPSFKVEADSKSVSFSNETGFEVYDYYGNVLKKGFGSNVDIASLPKGKYYLCYDNVVTEIEKKR